MTKSTTGSSPHIHEPNLTPPTSEPAFELLSPSGNVYRFRPADLATMPQQSVEECYIVSTGHGTSGPYTFSGVTLHDFLNAVLGRDVEWEAVELLGADGYGTGVGRDEIAGDKERPALLATHMNGEALSREKGLIRLIVPSETTDALRQVKWLSKIIVRQ